MRRVRGIRIVGEAREARRDDPRERGGAIERDREVAREQPVQDAVGELGHLVGPVGIGAPATTWSIVCETSVPRW